MRNHICLYYDSEKSLLEFIVPFFQQGLRDNETCIWIPPESIRVDRAKTVLCKAIKDLNIYIEKGRIELLNYEDIYSGSKKFDADKALQVWVEKEKQALKRGFTGIRVSGDASWVQEEDWEEFVDYERRVDHIIDKLKITALCTYPIDKYDVSKLFTLSFSHGVTVRKKDGKADILADRGAGSLYDMTREGWDGGPRQDACSG